MYHLFIGGHMHGQIEFIQQNQNYVETYEQKPITPKLSDAATVRHHPIIRYRRERFEIFPWYSVNHRSMDVFVCDDGTHHRFIAETYKLIGPCGVSTAMRYEREIKSLQAEDNPSESDIKHIHAELREYLVWHLQRYRDARSAGSQVLGQPVLWGTLHGTFNLPKN